MLVEFAREEVLETTADGNICIKGDRIESEVNREKDIKPH